MGSELMRFGIRLALLAAAVTAPVGTPRLSADIIPPGNKGVTHKLVFVDSPLLQSHRLIAMPVRGFGGHEEVQPGQPFRFSSKYGTRLYVVPDDFVPPKKSQPGQPLPYPSCEVPIGSTTFVPMLSPVDSLRSTCKLVAVEQDSIHVELVDQVELNSSGQPVTFLNSVFPMLIISTSGLIGCCLIWRRTRMSQPRDAARQAPTTEPAESD